MHILRKITVALGASLLATLLFTTGFSWSIFQVMGKGDSLKTALHDSGFYDVAISGALDQAVKAQAKDTAAAASDSTKNLPVDRADVRAVIEKAVPPDTVQTQAEGVIDNVYAWLHGEKSELGFTIDLTDAKAKLATGLGTYATERLSTLPVCPAGTPVNMDVDPFTAECVPAGTNIPAVGAKLQNEIATGDFLKDPQITAEDVKSDDGKALGEKLKAAPAAYEHINTGIFAAVGVMLLLATGIVFLSTTWRKGLRRVSIILISVGGVSAVLAWVVNLGLKEAVRRFATSAEDVAVPLQEKGLKAAYLLSNDLRTYWMAFGLVLVGIGVATLLVLHFTKPKGEKADQPAEPTGEDRPKPAADETAGPAHEKSADAGDKPASKPRKLVQ